MICVLTQMHPRILAGALGCESCHYILLSYGQCSQLVKSINVSQRSSGTPGASGSSLYPMQFVWTLQGCPSWMLWEGDNGAMGKQKRTTVIIKQIYATHYGRKRSPSEFGVNAFCVNNESQPFLGRFARSCVCAGSLIPLRQEQRGFNASMLCSSHPAVHAWMIPAPVYMPKAQACEVRW